MFNHLENYETRFLQKVNRVFVVAVLVLLSFFSLPTLATLPVAQLAKSVVMGTNHSDLFGVAVDISKNIYAAGYITGSGTYGFGNDITVLRFS